MALIYKVIKIAKEAGNILMRYYSKDIEVNYKGDDIYDPVTEADKKADEFIRKNLKTLFPKDYLLSEESIDRQIDYSGRVWMVDPLDGTKEFIAHNGQFAVMIGLCIDGTPTLGVVYAPVLDKLYVAEKGKGSYINNKNRNTKFETIRKSKIRNTKFKTNSNSETLNSKQRLRVSSVHKISYAALITRNPHGGERPLDDMVEQLKVKQRIGMGCVGLKLGLIAEGKAEVHMQTNYSTGKWDTCAPQVILEEAGGKVTDMYGEKLDYKKKDVKWNKSFVASNGFVHGEVVDSIRNTLCCKEDS